MLQLRNYSCSQIFLNAVASRVLTFGFCCSVPWCYSVGKIRRLYDRFKYVEYPLTCIVNLCDYAFDGSWWFHNNAVIHVPPEKKSVFVTTIMTPKGYVPITMSQSIHGTNHLVGMDGSVAQTCTTYHELFRPYSYSQQWDIFHPSVFGVCLLIRQKVLSGIFTNQSEQWWCW